MYLAQVVFNLRRQSVIQGEKIKLLRSYYFDLTSSVKDLEEKVAELEGRVEELENKIRNLGPTRDYRCN